MKCAQAMRLLVFAEGFAALAAPRGYAQSEINPDHFDSPNTEPFSQPKTGADVSAEMQKVRSSGRFTLPYKLQCAEKMLPPGHYSVSLHLARKIGVARLIHNVQTIQFAGHLRLPAAGRTPDALFVECLGETHRLSAIHLEELDFVIGPDLRVKQTWDGNRNDSRSLSLTRGT